MKKILCLFVVLFAVVSHGQDPVKQDWEAAPGIISGGYSEQEGPYIYKLCNTFSCPSLVDDHRWYYVQYLQGIAGNVGYGEFQHHGGGALISSDNQGEVTKADDGTWAVMYTHTYVTDFSEEDSPRYPLEFTGVYGPAYVYKKEYVPFLEARFTSENYVVGVGQVLNVGIEVTGGSGWETGIIGSKPAFLNITGGNAYSGICYVPLTSSITAVVKDDVTGQTCSISATITVTEQAVTPDPVNPIDPVDPTAPCDPSNPTDPSDPSSPSDPSNPSNPSDPVDPSNPDSPDEPTNPTEPDNPTEPENPEDPTNPSEPDAPNDPTDPMNPMNPDSPDNPDEPLIIVPDPMDPEEDPVIVVPDTPDDPDTPDEPVVVVPDPDPIDPDNDDDDEEPIIIVIDNNETSDIDKIIVTDDGVTMVRPDNYDLAIFMGMFGTITGLNGSATAPSSVPMAVQQAQQRSQNHE